MYKLCAQKILFACSWHAVNLRNLLHMQREQGKRPRYWRGR